MLALSELLCYAAITVVLDRKYIRMQGKVAMLCDVDSIKNINELSFGLEDTTYTTVQCELHKHTEFSTHSRSNYAVMSRAVKTEGKTVRVWGPLKLR
jgi:hypothetical protein